MKGRDAMQIKYVALLLLAIVLPITFGYTEREIRVMSEDTGHKNNLYREPLSTFPYHEPYRIGLG